jgi:hypothetical protein
MAVYSVVALSLLGNNKEECLKIIVDILDESNDCFSINLFFHHK